MSSSENLTNMEQLLDRIRSSTEGKDRVSVGDILAAVGKRSFGPVILVAGLITIAPLIGDIPGMPTLLGLIVLLTLGQLLFRQQHIWLPNWITARNIQRDKLTKGLDWLQKPARILDKLTRPRLVFLVEGPGLYVMVALCMAVALAMPAMEVIPFSANGGGAAMMAFGLAIIASDGVVALMATIITVATGWVIFSNLLG
ncbi:exopolysaccharide biosynthesis protein [Marinobacter changyiensis]|uniref:exopolysaccharide biosynthesis protein n=1 Tax=Marinobacter changyiensis TaxID=2604091 RepID=UPI001265A12D|nr:exopolysaccharide biosynthesis protein [Marinobacter changyiensis]